MDSSVKLLLTWDIVNGKEKKCLAFITKDMPAEMRKSGFELTDAWFTAYGDWPQVRMGFLSHDLESLLEFMRSNAWRDLKRELLKYCKTYDQKVIPSRGGFQI